MKRPLVETNGLFSCEDWTDAFTRINFDLKEDALQSLSLIHI